MTPTLQEGELQPDAIATAPALQGAYRLWARGRLLHIGHTSALQTLRGELRRHFRGDYGPRTQAASHFDYLIADDAGTRTSSISRSTSAPAYGTTCRA